nr:MAG TPA: hypothetical protein [Caudoviricetes sp.]
MDRKVFCPSEKTGSGFHLMICLFPVIMRSVLQNTSANNSTDSRRNYCIVHSNRTQVK